MAPRKSTQARGKEDSGTSEVRELLIDTSIQCFARFGIHRTRIEDVCDEAEVSRPTFYRYFGSRQELIDAVVLKQLNDRIKKFGPKIRNMDNFEIALTEGSVEVLSSCLKDEVFMDLLHRAHSDRLNELAVGTSTFFSPIAEALWFPIISDARETFEVREDLSDKEIVRWISQVHFLILIQEASNKSIREMMRKFVVPAILA